MMERSLDYAHVSQRLIDRVPVLAARCLAEFPNWSDTTNPPGSHAVFGLVVLPCLLEELKKEGDDQVLRRLFDFFEEMAQAKDPKVVNLLKLEIITPLIRNPVALKKAAKHMESQTRKLVKTLERLIRPHFQFG
jgi:hypothetical protein